MKKLRVALNKLNFLEDERHSRLQVILSSDNNGCLPPRDCVCGDSETPLFPNMVERVEFSDMNLVIC